MARMLIMARQEEERAMKHAVEETDTGRGCGILELDL